MAERPSAPDGRFLGLVAMLSENAFMAMGKLADPATNQAPEPNFEQAKALIDLIEMLQAKTEGNRAPQEDSYLQQTLTNLRLNFVSGAGGASSEKAGKPEKPKKNDHPSRVVEVDDQGHGTVIDKRASTAPDPDPVPEGGV